MKARYNTTLDPDIVEKLDWIASKWNRSRSNTIETMVLSEYDRIKNLEAGTHEFASSSDK